MNQAKKFIGLPFLNDYPLGLNKHLLKTRIPVIGPAIKLIPATTGKDRSLFWD
jgi:hypothetical protein